MYGLKSIQEQELEFNITRELNIRRRKFLKEIIQVKIKPQLCLPESKPIPSVVPVKKKNKKRNGNLRYYTYENGAITRGLVFELSIEQFNLLTSQSCTYCNKTGKMGIDRINSSIGYAFSNCTPCCKMCNYMKSNHSIEEFKQQIINIYNHFIKC